MSENKEKRKDKFDYESINEDSINKDNIENETFTLDKIETARFIKFRQNHRACQKDANGNNKFGAAGGGIQISFERTGIGVIVLCECLGCNQYANITNFDVW